MVTITGGDAPLLRRLWLGEDAVIDETVLFRGMLVWLEMQR